MIPHELTRRFASGKGAIFVGAGMSMGAELPSWSELVIEVARRCEYGTKSDLTNRETLFA